MIDAVLFDWGGTLTPFHNIDLIEMWAAAARVISPDASDQLADALLAAEQAAWQRTAEGAESFTTQQVIRAACESVNLPDPMGLLEPRVSCDLPWRIINPARRRDHARRRHRRERDHGGHR